MSSSKEIVRLRTANVYEIFERIIYELYKYEKITFKEYYYIVGSRFHLKKATARRILLLLNDFGIVGFGKKYIYIEGFYLNDEK